MPIASDVSTSTPLSSMIAGLRRATVWLVSFRSTAPTPAWSSGPRRATCVNDSVASTSAISVIASPRLAGGRRGDRARIIRHQHHEIPAQAHEKGEIGDLDGPRLELHRRGAFQKLGLEEDERPALDILPAPCRTPEARLVPAVLAALGTVERALAPPPPLERGDVHVGSHCAHGDRRPQKPAALERPGRFRALRDRERADHLLPPEPRDELARGMQRKAPLPRADTGPVQLLAPEI